MATKKTKRVMDYELRKLFNDGRYWDRAKRGDFNLSLTKNEHPAPRFLPYCTRSQVVVYYDKQTDEKVAIVHQYLQPDGTIGASGMPDPKVLYHEGVVYYGIES